jgi:hypothetical protein
MLWYAYSNSSINHSYMLSLRWLSLDMAVLDSARLLVLSFKLLCVELYYFSIIFLYSQTPWNRVFKDVDPDTFSSPITFTTFLKRNYILISSSDSLSWFVLHVVLSIYATVLATGHSCLFVPMSILFIFGRMSSI